jgi:polar amino acid transport system permease protein/polar amino acid transport system substrate-binding protein
LDNFINDFVNKFNSVFIVGDRYKLILQGLVTTLNISFFAIILGCVLGVILALLRLSRLTPIKNPILRFLLKFFAKVADIYIDIIRGTPAVLQLLIMYNLILVSVSSKEIIAIVAFGVNSGAYVAEIFRAGILAVDKGQMEASRSLGLNYIQSMSRIVIPQAIKNILPALANEFIVLLKETAIVGYIALQDLTKVGDFIVSKTYTAFFPLISIGIIYFTIIKILTILFAKLEGRLRKSDNR